jgi:hypothetical protein
MYSYLTHVYAVIHRIENITSVIIMLILCEHIHEVLILSTSD